MSPPSTCRGYVSHSASRATMIIYRVATPTTTAPLATTSIQPVRSPSRNRGPPVPRSSRGGAQRPAGAPPDSQLVLNPKTSASEHTAAIPDPLVSPYP